MKMIHTESQARADAAREADAGHPDQSAGPAHYSPSSRHLLLEPDTHCWDDDTGRDVWSHSTAQLIAYAEQAVAAQVDRLRDEIERLRVDAERYRWLRKNTIVLGIFHYQIDDELEELVDGRIAAARAALKEPT